MKDFIAGTVGWVGNAYRRIEIHTAPPGVLLKVDGGSDFHISPDGREIVRLEKEEEPVEGLDQEFLLGPVIVFALALRKIWSLHGSAATYNGNTIAFLAESGTGKSTLAAYLSKQAAWCLVADDILPVTDSPGGLIAWPHFPQLKLPLDAQPGTNLPEQLPLNILCELVPVDAGVLPGLKRLPPEKAVKVLLGHTAGTRLFGEKMLEDHLVFCAQTAEVVPVYQLSYPKSKDALPQIKEMLESLC